MSTYAVSDLHGQLELYNQINNFLKPGDTVYCLGDCGDRGPSPWDTVKAVAENPKWKYMMGNHEHMLAGAMCEYLNDPRQHIFKRDYKNSNMWHLLMMNGGTKTMDGWIEDGASPKWLDFLLNLPHEAAFRNSHGLFINMTHAGWTPSDDPYERPSQFECLWDREHLHDNAEWQYLRDYQLIVHGHTPIPYLNHDWKPEDGAYWYSNNHKVDIDTAAYATGTAVLLDLDTFDEHIFMLEGKQ